MIKIFDLTRKWDAFCLNGCSVQYLRSGTIFKLIPIRLKKVKDFFTKQFTFLTNRSSINRNYKLKFFVNLRFILTDNETLSKLTRYIIWNGFNFQFINKKKIILTKYQLI